MLHSNVDSTREAGSVSWQVSIVGLYFTNCLVAVYSCIILVVLFTGLSGRLGSGKAALGTGDSNPIAIPTEETQEEEDDSWSFLTQFIGPPPSSDDRRPNDGGIATTIVD